MNSLVINDLHLSNDFKKIRIEEKILSGTSGSAICRMNCNIIDDLIKESNDNRKHDFLVVNQKYEDLKFSLNTLSENVKSKEKIQNLDVDYFKQHVLDIERMLSDLKNIIKNESRLLQKNETSLHQEIVNMCQLNNHSIANPTKKKSAMQREAIKNAIDYATESNTVQRFHDFVYETGGHYGGWGEEEHNIFMKYCQNYQTQKAISILSNDSHEIFKKYLVDKMNRVLPDLSADDIINHHNWLIEYNRLKELQAKDIASWKAQCKSNECQEKLCNQISSYNISNKKIDRGKQKHCKLTTKKEIEYWKKAKQEESKIHNEIKAETIMIKKASSHDKEKCSKERELISKWAISKKREIDLQQLDKETALLKEQEKVSKEANKKIKKLRLRDNLLLHNRMTYINTIRTKRTQENPTNMIEKKTNQIKVYRCRQYNKPTEQWCRRIDKSVATFNNTSSNLSMGGVEHIPKLGVPLWREGISIR